MNIPDLSRLPLFEQLPTHIGTIVGDIVISEFWVSEPSNRHHCYPENAIFDDTAAYVEFFQRECRNAISSTRDHAAKTYQDIVDIVKHTQCIGKRDCSRAIFRHSLCASYPQLCPTFIPSLKANEENIDMVDNSIDLGLRLFLMVKTQRLGSRSRPCPILGETVIYWEESQSLNEVMNEEFNISPVEVNRDKEFSALLTAHNLERYGSFRIVWTSNLAEHLRITRYNNFTEVALYHYATVLRWHTFQDALPPGFSEETLRTLALLLPSRDFLGARYTHSRIDSRALSYSEDQKHDLRKAATYDYWRDRLLSLEKAFDESEPASLWQWWYDRRKRREWATFWVAVLVLVLTVFFGLIQSITGLISAWAAVKQLKQA